MPRYLATPLFLALLFPASLLLAQTRHDELDVTAHARALHTERFPFPDAEFAAGTSEPVEFDDERLKPTDDGFILKLPSGSPVPTPTIYRGRLLVSGGFNSEEFYAFDARSGTFLWGAHVSDDGPSSGVPLDDNIYFNTESCTLFALDVATGKLRWAHYLGDPMMAAPAAAEGKVFTVYAAIATEDDGERDKAVESLPPTYNLACFEAQSGKLLWRRWLDGDCITAPVCDGGELFVATLPGTLYRFQTADGGIVSVRKVRATSAPTVTPDRIYLTRRVDDRRKEAEPREAIIAAPRRGGAAEILLAAKAAPYLDRRVQEASDATRKANEIEFSNGIGGGFGGGFGNGVGGLGSGGNFAVMEEPPSKAPAQAEETPESLGLDPLAAQQQKAADNLGLGNVSTLQAYAGSRVVHHAGRNYNTMGDELLCTLPESGEVLWRRPFEGDLKKLGGHLGSVPVVYENRLFVATVVGKVLEIDPASGKLLHTYEIGSELRFPPAIADGRLYVGTMDGRVVCKKLR